MTTVGQNSLIDKLIDLYQQIKVRSDDDILKCDLNFFAEEKKQLLKLDPDTLINYIKEQHDIVVKIKQEEAVKEFQEEMSFTDNDKTLLAKQLAASENDVRELIAVVN